MGIPATLSTVPAQTPYIQYVATSGQTVFPYPFEITQDSDLVVVANGTTLATDSGYTLSGVGNSTGGNLTFTSGRTVGDIITLYRDIPIERLTQFAQNGGFSSTAFNAEFNNVYLLLQQLQTSIDQCLQIPNTNNPAPTVSLTPGAYANKYLSFDANGNPQPALLTANGTVTQSSLADLLWPQTTAESGSSVTPTTLTPPARINLIRYGADPTGTNASDAALSDAIAVCADLGGGTIYAPAGTYKFTQQISLASKTGIIIQGDGAATLGAAGATVFTYSGTGSSYWIDMTSAVGCQFRDLQITHSSSSFTGTYLKYGGTSADAGALCGLFDCTLGGSHNITHLELSGVVEFTAERCDFIYGNPSIAALPSGGFANAIRFRDCLWNQSAIAPVAGGGEAWEFNGCVFEVLSTGNVGAIQNSSATFFSGLAVTNCWFGDETSSSSAATWLNVYANGCQISGNNITGNATTTTATAIKLNNCSGVSITGNKFLNLSVGIDFAVSPCNGVAVTGNLFSSVATPWENGANIGASSLIYGANLGAGIPDSTHGVVSTEGFSIGPSGVIDAWGLATGLSAGANTVAFPYPFPNNCLNVIANFGTIKNAGATFTVSNPSTTGFTITITDSGATADAVYWRAVGN